MADNLTADEIRALLQLEPNATCGFVRQTYLSALSIAPNGCRRRLPTAGRWAPRSISW
jgi:hypothetical protein